MCHEADELGFFSFELMKSCRFGDTWFSQVNYNIKTKLQSESRYWESLSIQSDPDTDHMNHLLADVLLKFHWFFASDLTEVIKCKTLQWPFFII